jgi:photosystem II stability/assembly factor-like uncharacterized protein
MHASEDAGATWREINQGIVHKDVWSIVQHPRTGALLIGTSPAAVFHSEDAGEHWDEYDRLGTLPSSRDWTGPVAPHISRMKHISLSAQDPNLIYGAIEEGWAVRSLDGGSTWDQLAEGMDHDAHTINIMPDDPRTIIATGGKGIYHSTDRGDTWTKRETGLGVHRYTPAHVVVRPERPKDLLTVVSETGPNGWRRPEGPGVALARSFDQGQTWARLSEALPTEFHGVPRSLIGDPEDADTYFMGMTDGSVWISEDGGERFRQILEGLPPVSSLAAISR